jgi:hypothetical protein
MLHRSGSRTCKAACYLTMLPCHLQICGQQWVIDGGRKQKAEGSSPVFTFLLSLSLRKLLKHCIFHRSQEQKCLFLLLDEKENKHLRSATEFPKKVLVMSSQVNMTVYMQEFRNTSIFTVRAKMNIHYSRLQYLSICGP